MKNTVFTYKIWMLVCCAVVVLACTTGNLPPVAAQAPSFDPLAPGAVPVAPAPKPSGTRQPTPKPSAPATNAAPANAAKPADKPAGNEKSKKGKEDLKPRLEKLVTKDNVTLQIGYFPSDQGDEAVPVMVVHEWQGKMNPYFGLAEKLQSMGCAVALLNLRGHGLSQIQGPEGKPLEVERATKQDMLAVTKFDMEAVKKFLRSENNAKKLNLNALVVIGVQEGAILAMNWTVMDWNWPSLPTKKQGQDVKAMVLVSPVKSVNGVVGSAPQHPVVGKLPVMIVSGSPDTAEANRLAKLFEKSRVTSKFASEAPYPVEPLRVRSNLSSGMLVFKGPGVVDGIAKFVKQNVIDKVDTYPWVARDED